LIAASENIIRFIECSRLYEINEIINTDYWSNIIDINFEQYFEEKFSLWNMINKILLDSS